jgi:serine/threonine-protein kinase
MSELPPRPVPRTPLPPRPGLPAAGDVLAGKYVVERILGIGGMGAVLLAHHTELDERVAIKMLLPTSAPLAPDSEPVTRFLREARAAIKIRSEHVVRILDVSRLPDGAPVIVMEYLEGSDLARRIDERGPLTVEETIEYVVQACEAIAAAHAIGIIHRDLKPANLFLTRTADGRPCVKVLDFGISKVAGSGPGGSGGVGLTSTSTIMGTPCFMSPEQLRSTRDVDARTDIWSLGAILHALLAGSPPYDGESNADVSAKIIRDAPTPLRTVRPEVPEALEAIVLRCLDKDPAARFADVSELARALAAVSVSDAVKASAQRVVRGSIASAPTMASTATPAVTPSGPTRTASAWGETGRESAKVDAPRSSRKLVGMLAGVAVVAVLTTLGVVRVTRSTPPTPASASAAVSASPPAVAVVAPVPTEPPAASTVPAATSVATPPTVASSPTTRPARPSTTSSPRSTSTGTGTTPSVPPPVPTSKPSAGLFDGRE